jgi:hypothetical protein
VQWLTAAIFPVIHDDSFRCGPGGGR